MTNNTYYIVNADATANVVESIYGSAEPYCMSETEVRRLCSEWGEEWLAHMHEASEREIAEYGVWNEE